MQANDMDTVCNKFKKRLDLKILNIIRQIITKQSGRQTLFHKVPVCTHLRVHNFYLVVDYVFIDV